MKEKLILFLLVIYLTCIVAEVPKIIIDLEINNSNIFDARKYYNENNFTDEQAYEYIKFIKIFLDKSAKLDENNKDLINRLTGTWNFINNTKNNNYDYIDFKSSYEEIGFLYDSYYGYSFRFFGLGANPVYKKNEYIVSGIRTMGWIGPILRYEFQNEKMYLYILNMDKWELADFHEGGKNYFIKTSPTHTPMTP
jgi:hypothetical protein